MKSRVLVHLVSLSLLGQLQHCLTGSSLSADEPSLERLLELNAQQIFGGDATVKDGRVTVTYKGKGAFNRGFSSRSGGGKGFVSDADEIKNISVRAVLTDGASDLSFVGLETGSAISNFELAEDFSIRFKLKLPTLLPAAKLTLRWNQKDAKNFIETSFFQNIVVVEKGRARQVTSRDERVAGAPTRWFDQKSDGVPVEMLFKEKKATVLMVPPGGEKDKKVEIVSVGGIDSPLGGRIAWSFSRASFLIRELVIEGKFDRTWAEKAIGELRKKGSLKLEEPAAQEPPAPAAAPAPAAPETAAKPAKPKRAIDEADPEADEEL